MRPDRWWPLFLLLTAAAAAQAPAVEWPRIERTHKPWTRWWWHGSAVDRENLSAELARMAAAGIGGVEVTPIYGVKGQERRTLRYLSPEWVEAVNFTAAEARRLGMGLDLSLGSGWRTGGQFVEKENANASVKIERVELDGGAEFAPNLAGREVHAVVAFPERGQPVDLTPLKDALRWKAPPGRWRVFIAEKVLSGDNVKRPAPGGEGYSVDTYSAAALDAFLGEFGRRLEGLERGAVRAWFHDSFEYRGNWSARFFEEFERLRGYDLKLRLPALAGEGDPESTGRVTSDYRETLSDLLRVRFIERVTSWAHQRGSLNRNQAHGSPGNLLDLYAACDIPETEIFGPLGGPDSDPLVNKFASSAAHVTGKRLASSESYTWLNEHFTETLAELKRATDQLFVAGVNHIFLHGTAYSPADAAWPGWVFCASSELNPRNPIWRDFPALTGYIARCQSILQAGEPDNQVLLYWPYYDVLDDPGPMFQQLAVHRPAWLYQERAGPLARALWEHGYSFDYISDRQLAARTRVDPWKAVLVPETRRMPAETFAALLALARSGGTVVFHKSLPEDVPGLARLAERRGELRRMKDELRFQTSRGGYLEAAAGNGRVLVATNIERALDAAGAPPESFAGEGIQFVRRRHAAGRHYFLTNAAPNAFDGWLSISAAAASVAILDPMSGASGLALTRGARGGNTEVRLQLGPGESAILRTSDRREGTAAPWLYRKSAGAPAALSGTWQVEFIEGGPVLPAGFSTAQPASWTLRGGDYERFAGTARYTLRFDDPGLAANYLLDLGEVRDSARVKLNGRELGVVLLAPFRVETGPLEAKSNALEVEVTNVAANRIRDLDLRKTPWRIFEDINFVNIRYQPFDASDWPIRPAGLLGPVRLVPVLKTPRP